MAVNWAAQGVVGLSVEGCQASTKNQRKIMDAILWTNIHFFGLTRICASFVMGPEEVSQGGTAKAASTSCAT